MRCAALALALLAPGSALATPLFSGLGDLPGGDSSSRALGISGDGRVVVGTSRTAGGDEAFAWTLGGGMVPLGPGSAAAASLDGSVVVGSSDFGSGPEAFHWTQPGGMIGLGDLPGGEHLSGARGVSADGSVIVGHSDSGLETTYDIGDGPIYVRSSYEAFRWDAASGMIGLGIEGPGTVYGGYYSFAADVSADGSRIVGATSHTDNDAGFLWTASAGRVLLEECTFEGQAYAISADGGLAAGGVPDSSWGCGAFAIRLLPDGSQGERFFASGPGDLRSLRFNDASGDGSVLVGVAGDDDTGAQSAFVHSAAGTLILAEVLGSELGFDLTGWNLVEATGISHDGRTIVGWGTNPSGQTEGWMAIIPEPSSRLLLGPALAALAGFRLKRRSVGPRYPSRSLAN